MIYVCHVGAILVLLLAVSECELRRHGQVHENTFIARDSIGDSAIYELSFIKNLLLSKILCNLCTQVTLNFCFTAIVISVNFIR